MLQENLFSLKNPILLHMPEQPPDSPAKDERRGLLRLPYIFPLALGSHIIHLLLRRMAAIYKHIYI